MEDRTPPLDPKELEKTFGMEKVRRLFEAKELIEDFKGREDEVVHTEATYTWTQTKEELLLRIPLPPGTKAKEVAVTFTRQEVKCGLKGQPPLVGGTLSHVVDVEGCAWTLSDGELHVILTKYKPDYWSKVFG